MPPGRLLFYAATAAAMVLAVRGIFLAPLPFTWAALATLGYATFLFAGVLSLSLRVFVDAVVSGPRGSRGVALTFDDGPDPESTRRVLDVLDAAGVQGTFFVIGKKAEKHADLVREIVRRGHEVGLHSYAHDRLFSLRSEERVRADLERGMAVLTSITGVRPTLFRPPIGHTNPIIARVAEALDLVVVGWSVSARDGTGRAAVESSASRVRRGLKDGAIVLLHDAAERGDHTPVGPEVLRLVLDEVARRQLDVVPLARFLPGAT